MGSATPIKLLGAGLQRSPNLWDLLHARGQHENSNQILYGDRTRCEEIFTGSTTPPDLAKIVGDANADVRSVCDS